MKLKELLEKAGDFLDSKHASEKKKRKCLKEIKEKLEHQEAKLEKELKQASGSEKKKLNKGLRIVQAQLAKAKKLSD